MMNLKQRGSIMDSSTTSNFSYGQLFWCFTVVVETILLIVPFNEQYYTKNEQLYFLDKKLLLKDSFFSNQPKNISSQKLSCTRNYEWYVWTRWKDLWFLPWPVNQKVSSICCGTETAFIFGRKMRDFLPYECK